MVSVQMAETTSRESSRMQFLGRLGSNSQITEVVSTDVMFVTADMKSVIVRLMTWARHGRRCVSPLKE